MINFKNLLKVTPLVIASIFTGSAFAGTTQQVTQEQVIGGGGVAVNQDWLVDYTGDGAMAMTAAQVNEGIMFVTTAKKPNMIVMGEIEDAPCSTFTSPTVTVNGIKVKVTRLDFNGNPNICMTAFATPNAAEYVYNTFYTNTNVEVNGRLYSALGFRQSVVDVLNYIPFNKTVQVAVH